VSIDQAGIKMDPGFRRDDAREAVGVMTAEAVRQP
jgi:hypothetical protein